MQKSCAEQLLTSKGKFYINLGLERISKVLELLGNPQEKMEYFHSSNGPICKIDF